MKTLVFALIFFATAALGEIKELAPGSGTIPLPAMVSENFAVEKSGIIIFKNQPASLNIPGVPATEVYQNGKIVETPAVKWFYLHLEAGDKVSFQNSDSKQKTQIQYYFNSFTYIYLYIFDIVVAFLGAIVGFAFFAQYRDSRIFFGALFAFVTLSWNISHAFSFSINFFLASAMCGLYLQISLPERYQLGRFVFKSVYVFYFNMAFITAWALVYPWLSLDANRIIALLANSYSLILIIVGLVLIRHGKYLRGTFILGNCAWVFWTSLFRTEALFTMTLVQSFAIIAETWRLISGSVKNERLAVNAKKEIQKINAGLEQKVAERTRDLAEKKMEIETILGASSDAVFVIDSHGNVSANASKAAADVMHSSGLEDGTPLGALLSRGGLEKTKASEAMSSLGAILGEDEVAFELNEAQLPRDFIFNSTPYHAAYSPIIIDGRVERLVMSLHNQSEVEARKEALASQELLVAVHEAGPRKTDIFLKKADAQLADARYKIEANLVDNAREANISLHTAKGNARTLGFHGLAGLIHEAEAAVLDGDRDGALSRIEKSVAILDEIRAILSRFSERKDGDDLSEALKALRHRKEREYLLARMPSVKKLIEEYGQDISKIAADLGKLTPRLLVSGHEATLTPEAGDALGQLLTHALRNALDHGIERTDERRAKQKDEIGTICFRSKLSRNGGLTLYIADDGRGLNIAKIREKALGLGLINESSRGKKLCPDEIAEMIFKPGFSTASELSQVSGRGVGMDAIRSAIEKIGGEVRAEVLSDGVFAPWQLVVKIPSEHVIL